MTKEITKAIILQEIQDKLALREFEPSKFLFSEMVVPTYDVAPHLKKWEIYYNELSVASSGALYIVTVPPTQEWLLRAYQVIFMAAGAYTIAGLYIDKRPSDATAHFIYLDLGAAKNASYLVNLPVPVRLHPGNRLLLNVDGYTSTANIRINLDIQKETLR